jgi:hypothetical protein
MRGRAANAGMRRLSAATAVALFCAGPFAIFRSTVEDAATDFRIEFEYLVTGWAPWALIVIGSLCFVPVTLSIARSGYSRWYVKPATRHAYEAWGLTLYLLGLVLAIQTAQIAGAY